MPKLKEDEEVTAPAQAAPESKQYIVTSQHPEFTGTVMGVQITKGRGLLNAQSIDKTLGRSFEQVVTELSLLPGYTVTPA